jgi:hypothetical protein
MRFIASLYLGAILLVSAGFLLSEKDDTDTHITTATFGIHIWTWKRLHSLKRLMASLQTAVFPPEQNLSIDLIFHIDGRHDPAIPLWIMTHFQTHTSVFEENYEAPASCDAGILSWSHGAVLMDNKRSHLGLPEAIFHGISPESLHWQHEYCILLEDDVAVSPVFWDWVRFSLSLIGPSKGTSLLTRLDGEKGRVIIGASFYVPRLNEMVLRGDDFERWNPQETLQDEPQCFQSFFTYELPCSWGSILSRQYWLEIASFYERRRRLKDFSILPDSVLAKSWMQSWKKIALELMYLKKYVYLYPSTPHQRSYSTNFMEHGVHLRHPLGKQDELKTWHDDRYTVPLVDSHDVIQTMYQESKHAARRLCTIDMNHCLSDFLDTDSRPFL